MCIRDRAENELCTFAEEYFSKRHVSAAYLTGEGFDAVSYTHLRSLQKKQYMSFQGKQHIYVCMEVTARLSLRFEENIARVKAVVEKARKYGATVEAELGLVGGSEDGSCDHGIRCTDPDDAVVYARETGIDALAVAIGNAHGNYPVAPTLAFDVLEKIHEKVDIPLVLHGGSGITDKDFQRAISLGIRKVNIATASFNSLTAHVEKYMESTDKHNFFDLNDAMVQGTYENVKKHILVFNEPYQE